MRRAGPSERAAGSFLASVTESRLEAAWHLLALGLRVGEVLALRWANIDPAAGLITVRYAVAGVPYSALAVPPANRGERVIDALPALGALDRLQRRQQIARSEWGAEYCDHGFVVCRADGHALHPRDLRHAFSQATAEVGLPRLGLRDLRGIYASTRFIEQVRS